MDAANFRITRSMAHDLLQPLVKPARRMRSKSLCDEKTRKHLTKNLNNNDDVNSPNKMTGGQLNLSNYPSTSGFEFKNSDV